MARRPTRAPANRVPGGQAAPTRINTWTILFHAGFVAQLRTLATAHRTARAADPAGFRSNANVKLFAAVANLVLKLVPEDPGGPEYRQGNTLGKAYRDWRRAKFFGRFRLFFRYHTTGRIIVFAWVNDETTLRSRGSRSDLYEVFARMLAGGDPPSDWDALVKACGPVPADLLEALGESARPPPDRG